jgi:hypothetical protein
MKIGLTIGRYILVSWVAISASSAWPNASQVIDRASVSVVTVEHEDRRSIGSGFFVSKDGKFATNLHVIVGAQAVIVTTKEGRQYRVTEALAIDPQRDLAILRIPDKPPSLGLASSTTVKPGDPVIAIGAPKGLSMSATQGIVSAVRRSFDGETNQIQTDTPVNPGNSGGPLVNLRGQVVGLVTSKLKNSENLNFAIAAEHISSLLNQQVQPVAIAGLQARYPQFGDRQRSTLLPPTSFWKTPETGKIFEVSVSGDQMFIKRRYSRDDMVFQVGTMGRLNKVGDIWQGAVEVKHVEFDVFGKPVPCSFTYPGYFKLRVISEQSLEMTTPEFNIDDTMPSSGICPFSPNGKANTVQLVSSSPFDSPPSSYAIEQAGIIRAKCTQLRNMLLDNNCGYINTKAKKAYCGEVMLYIDAYCR